MIIPVLLIVVICSAVNLYLDEVESTGSFAYSMKHTANGLRLGKFEMSLIDEELRLKGSTPKGFGAVCYRNSQLFAHFKMGYDRLATAASDEWIFYYGNRHPQNVSTPDILLADPSIRGAVRFTIRSEYYMCFKECTQLENISGLICLILLFLGVCYVIGTILEAPEFRDALLAPRMIVISPQRHPFRK